jgi:cytidyltransferase-like protein
VVSQAALEMLPAEPVEIMPARAGRRKAVVTGCYDWLHSGHVRFFEEAAELGDLYVVVGNDASVRFLKGEGHPLFGQSVRRYLVGAMRTVHQALITSGMGWLDAEPEIARIKPDVYVVNEDGDKPEKRAFCAAHGLEYAVLKRLPRPGLAQRTSTDLRGF